MGSAFSFPGAGAARRVSILYTIERDGTGLTQLTSGGYDDIEPAWLPDGGIVFVSSRCRRWVNCWLTQVATVHRCDADGRNIRPLSANLEHDNTPWPMPDGRVLYTRWEYVDRSQVDYHHLWTMNPDGTGQAVYFGNLHPPDLYIDAKPIPGTDEILFINSPGHGLKEHIGRVALVHARQGPDYLPALRNISGNGFRDPYPLSENAFLVARGRDLVLMDREGVR
jgi:Tol biopolymer transport system component